MVGRGVYDNCQTSCRGHTTYCQSSLCHLEAGTADDNSRASVANVVKRLKSLLELVRQELYQTSTVPTPSACPYRPATLMIGGMTPPDVNVVL
jgi:hypothetical protein